MNFFSRASIRRKQTLIILLTSGTTLLLACASFLFYDFTSYRQQLVEKAASFAEVIGNNCTAALDFNDTHSAEETLSALRGEKNIIAAGVFRRDGSELAKYLRSPNATTDLSVAPTRELGHRFTSDRLFVWRPVSQQGENIGTVVIMFDLNEPIQRARRFVGIVLVIFLASMLVAFVLSSRLQRVISIPIQNLARAARAAGVNKDYSVRVRKVAEDELGQLTDGFNEMLSQIQERDVALQAARDQLEQRVEERTSELARSLSLLNATLESTADGILVVDQSGHITHYNSKFLEMWRIPSETVLQRSDSAIFDFVAAQLRNAKVFLEHLRQMHNNEDIQTADVLDLMDGRVFERHSQPQRVAGVYAGRVWCFRDITERKQAEEELRQRVRLQERLSRITATVPGVIYTFRFESEERICFPYASPRLEEMYGIKPEEVERDARPIIKRIHPDDLQRVRTGVLESARTMSPWRSEFRVLHPEQGEIWVEGYSMPERNGNGSVLWHGVMNNVTERKRDEAKIAALNKQLIETSRQAGMAEVATGVLHNVGNVLNSVNISATLISDSIRHSKSSGLSRVVTLMEERGDPADFILNDPRGKHVPRYLQQLSEQLAVEQKKNMAELDLLRKNIEHIKDIVAMQQNYAKVSGVTETVLVSDLVEDAFQLNAGALERHEITLVRDFQPVPGITVEKHKVLQILVNLIRNAKYACDEGGSSNKRITVRIFKAGEMVAISVSDTGIGIPPENMTRIFSHGFTTRKQGHGFGLHSGALVAKEMGGVLRVSSEGVGKGATFTLELPVEPPKSNV
mgnify:CR=1 FL=1